MWYFERVLRQTLRPERIAFCPSKCFLLHNDTTCDHSSPCDHYYCLKWLGKVMLVGISVNNQMARGTVEHGGVVYSLFKAVAHKQVLTGTQPHAHTQGS